MNYLHVLVLLRQEVNRWLHVTLYLNAIKGVGRGTDGVIK